MRRVYQPAYHKSINLHIIRKLIKHSLKIIHVEAMFKFTVFEILLFEGRLVLAPAQWIAGRERVKSYEVSFSNND